MINKTKKYLEARIASLQKELVAVENMLKVEWDRTPLYIERTQLETIIKEDTFILDKIIDIKANKKAKPKQKELEQKPKELENKLEKVEKVEKAIKDEDDVKDKTSWGETTTEQAGLGELPQTN
jgi:hypothetical protein